MAIPSYQDIMLPLLRHLGDGNQRSNQETTDVLAAHFNLTEQERKELLSSGQQTVFSNRVGWAKVYLKKAGLIESPQRGFHGITKRGIKVLKDNPKAIDAKFLTRFAEFASFVNPKKSGRMPDAYPTDEKTPREHLEYGYQSLQKELADELLKKVMDCPPDFFERLVVDLLLKIGYGGSHREAGQAIGKSGDGGIDGTIKEDRLGLDVVYIQAKRWRHTVRQNVLKNFVGALQSQHAAKGVFVTTSTFDKGARDYVRNIPNKVVLVDGSELVDLMIEHDVGVEKETSYEIKRLDADYFAGE